MSNFHFVLGDGAVGQEVAAELGRRGEQVVLASRSATPDDTHARVDALNLENLVAASRGASHIYITLGLPYVASIWEEQWPLIMHNVIEAARVNGMRVIYFDNIYAYGPAPLQAPITEAHPLSSPSRKGRVRKAIAARLMAAHESGSIQATIARAADYYGPKATNSSLYVMAISRLLSGKGPQLLSAPDHLHSYTYTLDAGRGLVTLALDNDAYGQVWHLPTVEPKTDAWTLSYLGELAGNTKRYSVMPRALLPVASLFVPILKDAREMLYQTDHDYVFSSAKFDARYPRVQKNGV